VDLTNALPEIERMYQILHTAVPHAVQGHRSVSTLRHGIVFDRVTFAYAGRQPLFRELCIEFPKGQFSAIVGRSGSGKTTIMNLLLGLYTPTSGCIVVDGVDLRDINLPSWYQHVGMVSQELFLFHASVLENIRLFHVSYTLADVERAARLAFAHDFITLLPRDYDTIVGERGMRLSGGQQQRLALARALLHSPDVLLLDEATSALDNESERLVQQAIQMASRNRTVIAVAHRLSTVQQADRIFVLEDGRLVGAGQHDELLAVNEHYRVLQA